MIFEKLSETIFYELKPKLEQNQGLSIFARERAKFEGWLKVELCAILSKYSEEVVPERNRVDVAFDNWAIELKTLNTNIRYDHVKVKTRPITKNTQGVIDDIEKLRGLLVPNKGVLFIVFPINHTNEYWQTQLERIRKHLTKLQHVEFDFMGKTPGVIYFGVV